MNDREPWYMKRGWRSGWGFGVYLLLLPAAISGAAAGFGWYFMWGYLLERYEWLYTTLAAIALVPWGWLFAPALVIAVTVVPSFFLCSYIDKRTGWGEGKIGRVIFYYTRMCLGAMAIGIFIAMMNL